MIKIFAVIFLSFSLNSIAKVNSISSGDTIQSIKINKIIDSTNSKISGGGKLCVFTYNMNGVNTQADNDPMNCVSSISIAGGGSIYVNLEPSYFSGLPICICSSYSEFRNPQGYKCTQSQGGSSSGFYVYGIPASGSGFANIGTFNMHCWGP
tara:strand:+ start:9335 stop:9790 length:456 start_codon:yes stop_codon:yes gene_type:complete